MSEDTAYSRVESPPWNFKESVLEYTAGFASATTVPPTLDVACVALSPPPQENVMCPSNSNMSPSPPCSLCMVCCGDHDRLGKTSSNWKLNRRSVYYCSNVHSTKFQFSSSCPGAPCTDLSYLDLAICQDHYSPAKAQPLSRHQILQSRSSPDVYNILIQEFNNVN